MSNPQLLFAKKEDLLKDIQLIYDSLIDATSELVEIHKILRNVEKTQNTLVMHVGHLRSIVSKDLVIRGSSPAMLQASLTQLKLSREQWRQYINSSISPMNDDDDNSSQSSGRRHQQRDLPSNDDVSAKLDFIQVITTSVV